MTTRWTSFAQFLGSYACLLYATAEKEKAWLQTHLSSGLFLWFVLGRGLLQSLSLSLSFPLHHAYALQPHHIWIHPRSESHVNQTPLKQSTELIRWHPVNIHLWKFEIIFGVFGFFSRENFEHLTSPGLTVPTAGDTVSGAPAGTTNSNDVGPTWTMGPEPILGTGWVNSLALVCELMTSIWAEHVSLTAVAFIFITEWDSSSGGRTPTARQWILNSRPIPVLQVRSNSYSCINNKQDNSNKTG